MLHLRFYMKAQVPKRFYLHLSMGFNRKSFSLLLLLLFLLLLLLLFLFVLSLLLLLLLLHLEHLQRLDEVITCLVVFWVVA